MVDDVIRLVAFGEQVPRDPQAANFRIVREIPS
jgi:hypothetical protein